MEAIKCDICGELEAGTGYLITLGQENRVCVSCYRELDSLKEKLQEQKKES